MAVHIKCGTDVEDADVAGSTIGEVKEQYQAYWNVDPEAVAMVNNKKVADDTVLNDGDKVEFVKSHSKFDC